MLTHENNEPLYRASFFKPAKSRVGWAQALGKMPKAHALQSMVWGDFKARWGWEAKPLLMNVGENSWEPLASALVLKRKIPYTPFCVLYVPKGPALDYNDGSLRRTVLGELERLAKAERAIFVKIDPEVVVSWGLEHERKSPVGAKFTQELRDRGWLFSDDQIQFRNTVELDVTRDEDDLLASMKSKTRYNIRLAGRKGVVVRQATAVDLPVLLAMYQETAERDGFAIRPDAYYLDAWQSFLDADMGQPLIAEYEGQPLGGVFLVRFADRVIYMYGASTNIERNRMPNYLLQWEAIRWAKEQGAKVYDFWGAPDEFVETDRMWGVWRFKDGFNGQVVRHIGAWDYPARPLLYKLYTQILPKYLSLLRSRSE